MEPKFQTSFIPKKPVISTGTTFQSVHKTGGTSTSVFMILAIVLFVASLAGVGGAYVWKQYLVSTQEKYKKTLTDLEKQFNPDQIAQLKQAGLQIDTARQLLTNHTAMSQLFDIISKFTIENVRFLTLKLGAPVLPTDDLNISMTGYGANLSSVAFQSDVLGSLQEYNVHNVVKNPIIADTTLDPVGTVSFGFSAAIDQSGLSYENMLSGTSTPNQ